MKTFVILSLRPLRPFRRCRRLRLVSAFSAFSGLFGGFGVFGVCGLFGMAFSAFKVFSMQETTTQASTIATHQRCILHHIDSDCRHFRAVGDLAGREG